MMDRTVEDSKACRGRLPYQRPALRAFGPIGALTMGGVGSKVENMTGGMASPNKKP